MQQNYVIKDRSILLFALLFFTVGAYSLFPNTKNINYFELATYQHQIKGVVTDSNGIPIPGVTVKIKGTSKGTFTNEEGVFFVSASPTDVLTLTYIGFRQLEVVVGSSNELSLVLQEDVTHLDEVTVNAGYYTVKERERTGSISKVTAEEIELQPIVSPLEALQGRMAGVEVIQQSGIPGSAPVIRIRGQNSLRPEGNFPLYIVDGVPINSIPVEGGSALYDVGLNGGIDPLGTLNLSNIESIEVLKDADATAIYGSRGANGVVLITTKKGTGYNRKTEIEARWYSGIGEVSRKMDLLNTRQYLILRRTALENDDREPDETSDYDLLLWDQNRYTDWQEELFGGTSQITNINISASGGNATTSFRLGGSYHKEGMVFPGDYGYDKITGGLHLNHNSENKKFSIDLSLNYGVDKSNVVAGNQFISEALKLPPNAPALYSEDGSLDWEEWEYSSWNNPLAKVLHKKSTDKGNNFIANLGLSYELLQGLTFKTSMGYTQLSREYKLLDSKDQYSPELREVNKHKSTENLRKRQSWIIEPQLLYTTKIGIGTINGLIGMTFQQNENKRTSITGEGYVSESLMGDISAAEASRVNYNELNKYKYNAIFTRIGYNYKGKYFINLTGRRDGSSRFGLDNRFANFWAVGSAWIFTEEPVVRNLLPFLSFGKVRGSFGTTGSDQIGDYAFLDAYEVTEGPNGLYPTQLTNPDYAWEENKKLEIAVDLSFMEDRIHVGASWYRNRSSNQLVGFPLPSTTGFNTVQANFPATVENTGWEVELTIQNIHSKDFHWQTFVNFTIPKNKLISFPNLDQTAYADKYRIGQPLNIQLLYQYDGIDPETDLYRVVDVNQDERFDNEDRVVVKNVGRRYFGGISNSIFYKGFGFRFLLDFVKQDARETLMGLPGSKSIQLADFFRTWQQNNGSAQQVSESLDANMTYNRALSSERFMTDASFMRLRTLSLSYDIPKELLQKIGLSGCKLFIQAQNLLTITNFKGLNIDYPGSNSSIPALRTITSGIQLHF